MKKHRVWGFTISEVLVVLAILGVLYSLTGLILHYNYHRRTVQAGLADVFREFDKAMFNYSIKKQCQGQLVCTGMFSNGHNAAQEISREYQTIQVGTNCWNGRVIDNNLDGSGGTTNLNNLNCFIDGKGRIFAIQTVSDCSTDYFNNTSANANRKHKLQNSCGYLFVDLNGEKSPNTFGQDVFIFIITDHAPSYLYPLGGKLLKSSYSDLSTWSGTCGDGSQEGRTCAGRIVEEGWNINYMK